MAETLFLEFLRQLAKMFYSLYGVVRADFDVSQTGDVHEWETRNQIRANEPKAKRMDAVVLRDQYRETNETKPTIGILGKIYGQ